MACVISTPRSTHGRFGTRPRSRLSPPAAVKVADAAGAPEEVDVAIFGAGPAGLSTALALHTACPDLKVHLYERARKLRPSGGSIGLTGVNAFAALREISPKDHGITRRQFFKADKNWQNVTRNEYRSTIIAWFELQRALMSCLPRNDMVSLGCELAEINDEEEGAVVATMRNGRSVRAKLAIGADGNRSNARKYVQGNTSADYVGAAVWRFFVPGVNPFVEVSDTLVLTGDCKTFVMQPMQREGKVLTYVAGISGFEESRLHELNQTRYIQAAEEDTQVLKAKLARFGEALKGFHPEILNYVLEHAVPDSVLEHPMYALDPRREWVRGRVALVGDSAHVMPPNMGQGTPMAIEDAVQLASSVMEHSGPSPDALAHYEKIRRDRVTPIWEESTRQATNYYKHQRQVDNPMHPSGEQFHNVVNFIKSYQAPSLTPGSGVLV